MHEDFSILGGSVHNKMFSTDEDSVYIDGMISFHVWYGGTTM